MSRTKLAYSREQLLSIKSTLISPPSGISGATVPGVNLISPKRKRTHRGCRSGVKVKNKKRKHKKFVPSVIFSNTQSLTNKLDFLRLSCRTLTEYRKSDIMCFVETWLNDKISDNLLEMEGFTLIRFDRNNSSNKKTGGGIIVYVNNKFCSNYNVITSVCTPEVEILLLNLRPYFLPREFTNIFFLAIYIPPQSSYDVAKEIIERIVSDSLRKKPNSIYIIAGDVNKCNLLDSLHQFNQFVTEPTRAGAILDHFYCNIKQSYRSKILPAIGKSDHDVVQMLPIYKRKIKREKAQIKTFNVLSRDGMNDLDQILYETDWDMFIRSNLHDINELTDTISAYITFCQDLCTETKTIRVFSNHKPWYTKQIQNAYIEMKKSFGSGDFPKKRTYYRQLIKAAKRDFKGKIELKFQEKNTKALWSNLKEIMNLKSNSTCSFLENSDVINHLNNHFCRFDSPENDCDVEFYGKELQAKSHQLTDLFEVEEVVSAFEKINIKKSKGPDNISGRLLKQCKNTLAPIFCYIFNWSLSSSTVPLLWKAAKIIALAKKRNPQTVKDFRPVALTCIVSKCMERMILAQLVRASKNTLDPYQFAYKPNSSTNDALCTFLHETTSHLDKNSSNVVRSLFLDFTSAFNTMQPSLLAKKLLSEFDAPHFLVKWVFDFLTNRTQFVFNNKQTSNVVKTNIGSPQGCILSPFLFCAFTNSLQTFYSDVKIIKYADDTLIVGKIANNDYNHYMDTISSTIEWCQSNKLVLNESKTKELIFDFRNRAKKQMKNITINQTAVEIVPSIKYLGCVIDENLNFNEQCNSVVSKAAQRRYIVYQLYNFNIRKNLIATAYNSFVRSVILYGLPCYFHFLSTRNKKRLAKHFEKVQTDKFVSLKESLNKVSQKIFKNIEREFAHPLHKLINYLPSKRRLSVPFCRTTRHQMSFIPQCIMNQNNSS